MKQRRPPKPRSLRDLPAKKAPSVASVDQPTPLPQRGSLDARPVVGTGRKYPHLSVYLPRRAVRLIKQIALDQERRISDVIADAVDDYLIKHGHKSLKELAD